MPRRRRQLPAAAAGARGDRDHLRLGDGLQPGRRAAGRRLLSIAQIGFVLLGIFVIDAKGAEGAILQMINHGIVVIGLFLIIGFLAERAGSEKLSEMGGLAKSAPVFATMFLIVALATLAMPGSANFVGETLHPLRRLQTAVRLGRRREHRRGARGRLHDALLPALDAQPRIAGDEETDARSRELDCDRVRPAASRRADRSSRWRSTRSTSSSALSRTPSRPSTSSRSRCCSRSRPTGAARRRSNERP